MNERLHEDDVKEVTLTHLIQTQLIQTPSPRPTFVFSFTPLSPASHELAAVITSFQRICLLSYSR
jgi:hypothetical protein